MSDIILFCLKSAGELRSTSILILSRIARFIVLDHPFVDELIETLTNVVTSRDLDSLEGSMICLAKIAKRGAHFIDLLKAHIPYSVILDTCEAADLSARQLHSIVDLLVLFKFGFTRTSGQMTGTLNRSVAVCVDCGAMDLFDRIRYLWWLLTCDAVAFSLFDEGWVLSFMSSCLAEPPHIQEFVLRILALILDTVHESFDFDWDAVFVLVDVPELAATAITVMGSVAAAGGVDFLVDHHFLDITRRFCLGDAPFKVRKSAIAALTRFLGGCGRERIPEAVDPELLGELVDSLMIEDVEFQRELYRLFGGILQQRDDIAQGFIDVFQRVGGFARNAELMDNENVAIANLATEFWFYYLSHVDESQELDWDPE
jgi:hypothetical protein